MANDETETATRTADDTEEGTERTTETEPAGTTAIDVEALDTYEDRVEALESVVEEQSERIETLENRFLDLSARVADGRNLGVCPECNGPTEKKERLFRSDTIECLRCGEVVHTY
ncbi:hypothetical protein [Halorubrum depositum]|uniref:hypothetical protein n=1 Tax=Halorubrum depositum TaxID=2583992 RepID=UPI00119E0332|nr:hypothetical protein [Halorubrum depositum]